MNERKYKADITEKEAKMVGGARWGNTHRKRYLWGAAGSFLGAIAFSIGVAFTKAPEWVLEGGTLLLIVLSFFLLLRMLWLQEKAGKVFAQALKEEK